MKQQAQVLQLVREAADRGLGVVLISHNMQQVLEVCDRVVVLFQGRATANLRASETSIEEIVAYITGAAHTLPEEVA